MLARWRGKQSARDKYFDLVKNHALFPPTFSNEQFNATITVKIGKKWPLADIIESIGDQFYLPIDIKVDFYTIIGSQTQPDDICYPSRATALLTKNIRNQDDLKS